MKKINLKAAAEAFEMIDGEMHLFYNTETGEFDFYSDFMDFDETDSEKFEDDCWLRCPSQRDIGEYDIMADFADTVTDPRKNELLSVALEGRGAFRRFKDTLHRVDLAEEWYAFKHLAYVEIAREWCEDNELPYVDDTAKVTAPVPMPEEPITSLNTMEAIRTRYSCRAFSDKMPPDKLLQMIAEAAVAAPSGMNRQLWRIVVVKNQALIADLEAEGMKNLAALQDKSVYERIASRGGKLFYNAPCMIVVPIAKAEPAGAELFDCGIVAENIALAATSLGIDSLICGLAAFSFAGDKNAAFKRRLEFPEGYEIGIAVLLGYAENPGGKPHEPDLSKITIYRVKNTRGKL